MIKNILSGIFVAIVIIAAVFIVFNIYAKDLVVSRMQSALGVKVGLEKISLNFPLSVELKGLELGSILSAERIKAAINPFGFIAGKVLFDEIRVSGAVVNLEQSSQGKLNLPVFAAGGKGKSPQVFASRIIIQNGIINFTDYKVSPQGFKVSMNKINADIAKAMLAPTSLKIKMDASCEIAGSSTQPLGGLALKGWVDFGPKDMDAVFTIKALEAVYFTPYFGNFLSSKILESATVNLVSQLKAKDNDLNISTDFNLSDLKYAPQDEPGSGELPEFSFSKNALDLFADKNGNLKLNFEIRTKMDRPHVSQEELKKIMLNAAVSALANQNPVDIFEKVGSIIEQASKYGKQMKDIFSGKTSPEAQPADQNQ